MDSAIITPFVHHCPVDHSGTMLHVAGWQSDDSNPVLCLHDFGESASLYKPALELLACAGVSAYGYNMRGHGDDQNGFSGAKGLQIYQRDLLQVAALVKHAEDGRAPVILANGLSCILALRLARAYPKIVGGLILIDPPHHSAAEVSRFRHGFTKALADLVPAVVLPVKILSAKNIMRTSSQGSMSAGTAHELFESVARIPAEISELTALDVRSLIVVHDREHRKLWLNDLISCGVKTSRLSVQFDPSGPAGYIPAHLIAGWILP